MKKLKKSLELKWLDMISQIIKAKEAPALALEKRRCQCIVCFKTYLI